MNQTLVATLAMMIFSLFAVQHKEKTILTQQTMIRQAVTAMLNGAAVERLEEIGSKGYDQATVDNETLTSLSGLASSSYDFGPGNDHTPGDDLDDFHEAADTLYRAVGTDSLGFILDSEVVYASEANTDQPSTGGMRTKFKLITVTARSELVPNMPTVTVSRSISCGSACAW